MMFKRILSISACVLSLLSKPAVAETPNVVRSYRVEAKIYSLDAQRSLDSYQGYGGGWGSPGSTLGYAVQSQDELGRIEIKLTRQAGRLLAEVITHPLDGSEERRQRIDLTDLRATSVQLAKDDDGRTYEINLTPTIIETRVDAESFRKAAKDLYELRFNQSPVVLNEKQYIGRMLASGAHVASLQICGLADLEFSLHHLKDAKSWGVLEGGRIRLNHPDGTSIEIGNVTNGSDSRVVTGGPYQVWVRWKTPAETVQEYRDGLTAFREQLLRGDQVTLPDGETVADPDKEALLRRVDDELARPPVPWVTGTGARGLNRNDLPEALPRP